MAEMQRGANVALTREVPNLAQVALGIRWDAGSERVLADNLVFAALLCGRNGAVRSDHDVVFFNQVVDDDLSVTDRDAALDGDGEQIVVDLAAVPEEIARIVAVLYVNDGPGGQHRTLGQLHGCAIRVLDASDNRELVRSQNLAPEFDGDTAVTLGELYRHDGWKFRVLGQGYRDGVAGIAADFGIPL